MGLSSVRPYIISKYFMKQNLWSPAQVYAVIFVTVKSLRCLRIKWTLAQLFFFNVIWNKVDFMFLKIYRNAVEAMQKLTLTQYSKMRNT